MTLEIRGGTRESNLDRGENEVWNVEIVIGCVSEMLSFQ